MCVLELLLFVGFVGGLIFLMYLGRGGDGSV
jgi:hypothetical protein